MPEGDDVQNEENKDQEQQDNADKGGADDGANADENEALVAKSINESRDELHRTIDPTEVCCCCICQCSREETRLLSCCGCFPIKCGLVSTGILTLLLILSSFIEIFYFILNDYIHWWFVLIAVLLLIPAIIGACFLVSFFNNDNHSARSKVRVAYIFVIISYSLLAVWNIIYFNAWYKNGEVVAGGEQTGYYRLSKKQYLFWSLFITCIIDAVYAYFICVIAHYKNALRGDKDQEDALEAKRQAPYVTKQEQKDKDAAAAAAN
jgi:hypothetical protein